MKHTPIKGESLQITPFDIDVSQHFWNAFDHSETEVSANWIVQLCQRQGSWDSFSRQSIEDFYGQKHKERIHIQ